MIEKWNGVRVTVMGLGAFGGGIGVTQWLARQGARVLVTDKASREQLSRSLARISDLDVELRLGGHEARDFTDTDVVVVSPAVPERSPYVQAARAAGVPITTEINLFVERCPARVVAITGSVGKSTTTAMTGAILERALRDGRGWVGGNLGFSLLGALSDIAARDTVVLELSSFQLQRLAQLEWAPRVALVTNLTPNHLDWHASFEEYAAAKGAIFRFQDPRRDTLIIQDRAELDRLVSDASGRSPWRYAQCERRAVTVKPNGERLVWDELRLLTPGVHNIENAAGALTIAEALGVERPAALEALSSFEGLPHRLQRVLTRDGVTYYNDSKSTTPESAVTAMRAIESPALVVLGGYDKGVDISAAAELAAQRAKYAACIGQTGAELARRIAALGGAAAFHATLEEAVQACASRAAPGDAILFSPGCASYDMFENYTARGEAFVRLARGEASCAAAPG